MTFVAFVQSRFASVCLRVSLLLVVLGGLSLPAMAASTVTYTGTTTSQNLGTVNVGSSNSVSLSFSVSGSIGSVEVVTQGAPNLDFTNGGGTCTDGTTSACKVDVTFKPIYAGLRRGAVLFWSGAGNTGTIIGKTFVYGVGNGGQIVYGPGTWTTIANPTNLSPNSFSGPEATTVDGSGNLYIVDSTNARLVEYPAGGGAAISIDPNVQDALNPAEYSTLYYPGKVVVDGAGDVWIADTDEARVVEIPVGGGTPLGVQGTISGTQFNSVEALDVDGLGNVYITDTESYRVLELTSISSTGVATGHVVNLQGNTLLFASDVWLDAAGDLFISDVGFDYNTSTTYIPVNPQVLEVHANGTVTKVTAPGTGCGVEGPWSAEGDAAGNLFIGDEIPDSNGDGYFSGRVVEYPAGGGDCIITGSLLGETLGGGVGGLGIGEVNLSASGDIYVSDQGNNRVLKMQRSVAPTVAFSHSTVVGAVDITDGTKTVQISNIGNATLDFSELTYPADFTAGSGVSSACTSSSVIAINASCNVGIEFSPKNPGSLNEDVILTNNANGGSESITVTGTATGTAPTFTSGSSTTFTVGTSGSFAVTASGNPTPTFSETGALPSGVTFSTAGLLSGTPAADSGGTYSLTITAANEVSPNATQSFTLTVDQAPAITSAAGATFTVGTAGSFSFTATGYPTAMTYSVTAGSLPSGVTLSTAGVLSGTPAAGTGGSYPLTITASNGVGTAATQSFTLAVNQAPTFNIGTTGGVTMTVGGNNEYLIFTTGYPTAAITESGALPIGITFVDNGNGHGTLAGVPAAGTGGVYPVVFTANNGIAPNGTLNYTITINQPIAFTSAPSTTFIAGTSGSFNVTSTGYPAATYSETGALPTGVTFSSAGVLSGTPAPGTGGSYSISIQATNGLSSPSQSFTLTVDQAPAITSANNATFVTGSAGTFIMTTTGYPTAALVESGPLPSGVTFTDNGNGTGTLAGITATAGSFPITIIASNGIPPNATQNFTLTTALPEYPLTTAANPALGGFVLPQSGTPFTQGSVVPLQATPATGYTFVGWTSAADPVASATSASTTITVNGPESVIAQFAPTLVVNTSQDDAGTATNCSAQPTPGTNSGDSSCSLRDALLNAANSGAGSITFDSIAFATAQTITLTNGTTLTIPTSTTITGPTSGSGYTLADLVTVAGGGASSNFPVFTVNSSAVNTAISNLIISNGNSTGNGGGIVNGYGAGLTVTNSTISGNTAASGTGGIFNDYNATLTVSGSTISGNSGSYGGIVNESGGAVTITSSTIANNTGAGVSSIGNSVTVTASTISGNSGGYSGGGINIGSGAFTLANSIVAGNTATSSPDVVGTYTDNGGNFIPGVNGATLAGLSLAPLASYGGPTQTMVPTPGNMALCGGTLANATAAGITTDQRGLPFDPLCPSGSVDSGAVESNYALGFTTEPPANAIVRAALSPAPAVTLTESGVVFAPATSTVTITDLDSVLSATGTNSAALASGSATFSNLILSSLESGDTLTATLSLNPNLATPLNLVSAPSTAISVTSGTPSITSVSQILPQQTQTITISGSGFGTQSPYSGDSSSILFADHTGTPWYAGNTGNAITLSVTSWTDSQIVLAGFTGAYGADGACIKPGDQLYVKIWNPQTGNGPAYYPITANSGTNTCDLTPTITSVSAILPQQTQTITISGYGFGTQSPYTGDSSSILLADSSGTPWYAGNTGNAVNLAVSSWSDSEIVLTGFAGAYGTNAQCIKPGDQLYLKVWNAQSGSGPAYYPVTANSGTNTCDLTPTITSVSAILPQQTQTITISGSGFGTQAPYTGDSSSILVADSSGTPWYAGNTGNAVNLAVSSWTDSQIVISGFTGAYGNDAQCIKPGDQLYIKVWNAQSGSGPAYYPITANSGTNTCDLTPTITSVSQILPQQTQTITISGYGFGTQAPYNGDSNSILLADSTGTPVWYAGNTGNPVTLAVSSWSDTQIVITGFTGQYGTDGQCINPGDQLYIKVWNAQAGNGPAYYPITAGSGTRTCVAGPTITSVSAVLPQQTQTITITGSGFGTQAPYTGDSSSILFADHTGTPWYAGDSGNAVTLSVSSWTDSQIVITGFAGQYGTSAGCIRPGDQVYVKVWNAQTGSGPAYYPITAASGTNTCP